MAIEYKAFFLPHFNVVTGEYNSLHYFSDLVNNFIIDGYEPIGNAETEAFDASKSQYGYQQTLIKKLI